MINSYLRPDVGVLIYYRGGLERPTAEGSRERRAQEIDSRKAAHEKEGDLSTAGRQPFAIHLIGYRTAPMVEWSCRISPGAEFICHIFNLYKANTQRTLLWASDCLVLLIYAPNAISSEASHVRAFRISSGDIERAGWRKRTLETTLITKPWFNETWCAPSQGDHHFVPVHVPASPFKSTWSVYISQDR